MNKLITIDYEEYLELVKYKESLEELLDKPTEITIDMVRGRNSSKLIIYECEKFLESLSEIKKDNDISEVLLVKGVMG